jgi:hypothetical protein
MANQLLAGFGTLCAIWLLGCLICEQWARFTADVLFSHANGLRRFYPALFNAGVAYKNGLGAPPRYKCAGPVTRMHDALSASITEVNNEATRL